VPTARATSLEASLRWRPVHAAWGQRLELSLFRTDNRDDILFDSVSATSQLCDVDVYLSGDGRCETPGDVFDRTMADRYGQNAYWLVVA
jgi:hypothetical protein